MEPNRPHAITAASGRSFATFPAAVVVPIVDWREELLLLESQHRPRVVGASERRRPDSDFPDTGELSGAPAARRFFEDQREFMGAGRVEILEEHDLGDRCLLRLRQNVDAPASGVRSSYDSSVLTTAHAGKVIGIEFFIDRRQALAAAGLL